MKKLLACVLILALLVPCAACAGFASSSSVFDPSLAQRALQIAESCYLPDMQLLTLFREGYMRTGLYNAERDREDPCHVVTWAMYEKAAEGGTDVIIAVRGTGEGEWPLNMDLMPSGDYDLPYAENFLLAAQDILDTAWDRLSQLPSPSVLVTGHSRGAAAANLLGAMLTDRLGADSVYVYTFATPRTVRGQQGEYANIFNVINPADMVTCLPLPQWGFGRFGTDILLPAEDPAADQRARAAFAERSDALGDYVSPAGHVQQVGDVISLMAEAAPDVESAFAVRHAFTHAGAAEEGEEGMTLGDLLLSAFDAPETFPDTMRRISLGENDFTKLTEAFSALSQTGDGWSLAMHLPAMYGAWLTAMYETDR